MKFLNPLDTDLSNPFIQHQKSTIKYKLLQNYHENIITQFGKIKHLLVNLSL